MNIVESNRLVMAFMKVKMNDSECRYHSDWSLLMPVVEKIESGTIRDVMIYDLCCRIEDPATKKVFMGAGATKIEAVYSAVVAFIEFYNKQKEK